MGTRIEEHDGRRITRGCNETALLNANQGIAMKIEDTTTTNVKASEKNSQARKRTVRIVSVGLAVTTGIRAGALSNEPDNIGVGGGG
jgi:hypothetical protein